MIQPQQLNGIEGLNILNKLSKRLHNNKTSCVETVAEILEEVRKRGDKALVEYGRKFDCPILKENDLKVSERELAAAYNIVESADAKILPSIQAAIERIRFFHTREMEDSWLQTRDDGTIVGRLVRPVDSAGLYVPGGTGGSTPLVSSVLMNGIPAEIAGVCRRILVTPPSADGSISPYLLVAAQEIGIRDIFRAGSAWGVGALAYGTESIAGVDVIVGPGNQFVAEAKRQLSGVVRIDMIAGPSEVLIIADATANPAHIAADMLAQAEHDPLALSLLITTDSSQPEKVLAELQRQLPSLSRQDIARSALENFGQILVAESLEAAIAAANEIAIEHLELSITAPWEQVPHIRHAGAIFLGRYTPEAAGDYFAGPNHVLPTMGTARFASALGVETFLKKSSIISYSKKALYNDAEHIVRLAQLEGLGAHANSVKVRVGV